MSTPATRLRPLELAWGVPWGRADEVAPLQPDPRPPSPRQALEAVVRRGLLRPPCLVSFSGGRDSSTVLALATHVARTEGLPLPVPVTHRFPALAESDEDSWQEAVVRRLALTDWQRLRGTDELDVLGPVARRALTRHGVLAPFNAHFHDPLLAAAGGGSLLTGIGGDELFAAVNRSTTARLLHHGRRPPLRHLPRVLWSLAPAGWRAAVTARRTDLELPWVLPAARARLVRGYSGWQAQDPLSWQRSLRSWYWPGRSLQLNLAGKAALAADHDTVVLHPFADPGVLAAAAARWGDAGPLGRRAALQELVGELLPPGLAARRSKATFDGAFWAGPGREFAAGWDGSGVDPAVIDVEALRREWLSPAPDAHSFSLLQAAWLHARAR